MKTTTETTDIDVIQIIENCAAPSVKHKHCEAGCFLSVSLAEISKADAKALLTIGRAVASDAKARKNSEDKNKATAKKDNK